MYSFEMLKLQSFLNPNVHPLCTVCLRYSLSTDQCAQNGSQDATQNATHISGKLGELASTSSVRGQGQLSTTTNESVWIVMVLLDRQTQWYVSQDVEIGHSTSAVMTVITMAPMMMVPTMMTAVRRLCDISSTTIK
jgi:hypothetical protein